MARITTYINDDEINPEDKVIGTDGKEGVNFGKTKNFTVGGLASYINSEEGFIGTQGIQGPQGPAGVDGVDGATGPAGATGPQGPTGQTGLQGPAGADGTSIAIQGTKETVGDLPISGSVNDLWIINTTGDGAEAGDGYVWTEEGSWENIGPIRGPQGEQGPAGPQGIQGAAGVNGSDGVQGAKGDQGIQGIQGVQGIQGETGLTGPQGEQGIQGPAGADGADGVDGTNGTNGTDGVDGADGLSAYEIWIEEGNTGTEQDFLDSLAGAPGGVSSIIAGSNVTIDPSSGVGDVTVSSPDAIVNTEDTFTSTPKITNIVSLTEAEYTALSVKENDTLYILI